MWVGAAKETDGTAAAKSSANKARRTRAKAERRGKVNTPTADVAYPVASMMWNQGAASKSQTRKFELPERDHSPNVSPLVRRGGSSMDRASVFETEGCGFDPRPPRQFLRGEDEDMCTWTLKLSE